MSLSPDRRRKGLEDIYIQNIEEAFSADKEMGVYVNCEFNIDLQKNIVTHTLASTNGSSVCIIQKDVFPYDREFKTKFLEWSLSNYVLHGVMTILRTHDMSLDPEPKNAANLKSVSSANNIICINGAEIEYINKLHETMKKIKETGNKKLAFANQKAAGIIDAVVLAFLVGLFDGGLLMFLLKFVIK